MNKKILLGSILSMVILILVSFTSVVGYRSVASDVKASPLFNIRSSRAIEEESEDLSCEYVGRNKGFTLSFPQRDSKIELVHKFINNVRKMNNKSYDKLMDLFIQHKQERDDFQNYSKKEISLFINQLENRHPPTLYTCLLDPPLFCFSKLIRYIIELIILTPIFLVACIIVPTNPTFN